MNISVKAEYALSAILDLALQPRNEPVRIADIAKRQNIPQKFLELILSSLKQGGFVESRRGAEGGYLLSRPADTITVAEIIHFIDGAKTRAAAGKRRTDSAFCEMWQRVDSAISAVLDHTSFGDLSRAWLDKKSKYVPNWDI